MRYFKHSPKNTTKGFTLAEVMTGVLLTGLFTAVSMQGFVTSTSLKVKARQISEANNWAMEDLETVKTLSLDTTQIPFTRTRLVNSAVSGQNIVVVEYVTGLQARDPNYNPNDPLASMKYGGDPLIIGTDSNQNIISAITHNTTATPPTTTITLVDNLQTAQNVGSEVYVIARCRPQSAASGGFAAFLKYTLDNRPVSGNVTPTTPNVGSRTILGRQFTLTRTTSVRNAAPYQVLEVAYRITDDSGSTIAMANTEVVPNASFQCP
jgi:type II secretory pathway pseudopilin PulG